MHLDSRKHAYVIGSYVAGCIARADRLPAPGETLKANDFLLQPGGKGFNLMAGLYRLGTRVDGVLPVGDDLWGRLAPAMMRDMGLPVEWLFPLNGPSGGAIGLVDRSGENSIAVFPGANERLSVADIGALEGRISTAAIVAAQLEVAHDAVLAAFRIARAAGVTTLLNPSPYDERTLLLLPVTDILVMNEGEAICLAAGLGVACAGFRDAGDLQPLADALCAIGIGRIVITLGAVGAWCFRVGEGWMFQSSFGIRVIDTTGAGDAFCAGFIAGLLNDLPDCAALELGAKCAALVCRGAGVFDNLPTLDEVSDCANFS